VHELKNMFALNFFIHANYTCRFVVYPYRAFCQEPDTYTSALHYDYSSLYGSSSAWLTRHNADYKYTGKNLSLNAGVSVYETDYNNTSSADARAASITSLYTNVTYNLQLGDNWGIKAEAAPKLISELKNSTIKDLYPGFYVGFTYNPEKSTACTLPSVQVTTDTLVSTVLCPWLI
jgi:hypothetical protein